MLELMAMESQKLPDEGEEQRIERYAATIEWYMDHPEDVERVEDEFLKAFIKHMIRLVEEYQDSEGQKQLVVN